MSDDQADFTNTFRLLSTVRHSGNEAGEPFTLAG